MDRKGFLKKSAMASGSFVLGTSVFSGCGGDSPTGGILGGGGDEKDPWDSLEILVDEAYNTPEYSVAKRVTDNFGQVSFYDRYDESTFTKFFTEGFAGGEVSGLDINFFREYRYGNNTGFLLASDPQGRYMPKLISLEDGSRFSLVKKLEDSSLRIDTDNGTYSFGNQKSKPIGFNLFIDEVKDALPSYEIEDMDDLPGYFYVGDWSFDSLKNVNTILKFASAGVTLVFPNPATAAAYTVLETSGNILKKIDYVIEGINIVRNIKGIDPIDKHLKHSVYGLLSKAPKLVFFPSLMSEKDDEFNIRDLIPISEGNSWTYSDGMNNLTSKVIGKKKIKGKNLAVVRNVGDIEEYFGFFGNSLNYYGFNFSELGDVFFSPAIEFGDNRLRPGRDFRTQSKIIFKDHSEISGDAEEIYRYVDTENVLLSSERPFGDCFKVNEEFSLKLVKDGESSSDVFHASRWFAKNLGPVKIEIEGQEIELVDSNLNSRMEGFGLFKQPVGKSERTKIPTLSQKIVDAYRRIS